jgi:DNA excision repair protein ERCC-1
MDDDYDDADFIAAAAAIENSAPTTGNPSTARSNGIVQPKPQTLPSRQGPSAILVSTRQKGNPILNHVKQVPWEYSDIPCDYVVGATTCALFLSLKYHRLHPEYIYSRIRVLGKLYNLRILLTMVDITNHEEALKELSKTSMINNLTLILCWSAQEAGRYLELFKSYEHASPASIRAHQAETYRESLTEFVTTPRTINKTDAASLISHFGTLQAAVNAGPEELALVPGWGEKKVKSWVSVVREPFRVKRAGKASAPMLRQESTLQSESGSMTPDGPGTARTPIPISTVPSMSRENTRPESSHVKRARLEELRPDELDDADEAMMLAQAEVEAIHPGQLHASRNVRKEPELADGVAAALAKLREKG